METNTVSGWWASYAENCVPPGIAPILRDALEHAFYAGSYVMLQQINQDDSNQTLNASLAIRESLDEEMRAYFDHYNVARSRQYRSSFPPGHA